MFSVDFRLSVGAEGEERKSAWIILLCSWEESGFMCLFLEDSGERLYLRLLEIREEEMSELEESDGEEEVELSDVAEEDFEKEEEDWDEEGVA